jgi:hypothetical protein
MARVTTKDGNGNILHEGDRVFTDDENGSRIYGTLRYEETFRSEAEWTIEYDDGETFIVLDFSQVYNAANA